MVVKTDLDSVDDKKLTISKENDNPKECLQVTAVKEQNNDDKGIDFKPVDTQSKMSLDVVKSIRSSAVGGQVDVVKSIRSSAVGGQVDVVKSIRSSAVGGQVDVVKSIRSSAVGGQVDVVKSIRSSAVGGQVDVVKSIRSSAVGGQVDVVKSIRSSAVGGQVDVVKSIRSSAVGGQVDVVKSIRSSAVGGQVDVVKSIRSSAVGGQVDVVNSKNVIICNGTYFNGPVRIKKLEKKHFGSKNTASVKNGSEHVKITSDIQEGTDKTTVKSFQISRWYLNTIGLCIVTLGILFGILFNRNSSYYEGSTPLSAGDDTSMASFANMLSLFRENLNVIAIAVMPFALLLIAKALLIFYNVAVNMRKRDVGDLEEEYDSLMRPTKKVKTPMITPEGLKIISRTVWHAEPLVIELERIRQPVPWVIISHTATGGGNTLSECIRHVRVIQSYHKDSQDWDDIGYNFLVGGDGAAYYGRGWDYIGAHTFGYNKYSMGISFIGTFIHYPPPKKQLEACKKLLKRGVALGKLAKDYKLIAHRQLWATQSPGDKLFDVIKEWPHFVKEYNDISEIVPDY